MSDKFIEQVCIGVGIVTCFAFGVSLLLYWVLA
jgi:hypothetical protein